MQGLRRWHLGQLMQQPLNWKQSNWILRSAQLQLAASGQRKGARREMQNAGN